MKRKVLQLLQSLFSTSIYLFPGREERPEEEVWKIKTSGLWRQKVRFAAHRNSLMIKLVICSKCGSLWLPMKCICTRMCKWTSPDNRNEVATSASWNFAADIEQIQNLGLLFSYFAKHFVFIDCVFTASKTRQTQLHFVVTCVMTRWFDCQSRNGASSSPSNDSGNVSDMNLERKFINGSVTSLGGSPKKSRCVETWWWHSRWLVVRPEQWFFTWVNFVSVTRHLGLVVSMWRHFCT